MKPIAPPAIVRESPANLEQLAFAITATLEAADRQMGNSLQNFRDAGEALLKAKAAIPFGCWLKWLSDNKISPRSASRAINAFKSASLADVDSELLALASDNSSEQEKTDPSKALTTAPALFCRACRTSGFNKNCKDKSCQSWKATHPKASTAASAASTSTGGPEGGAAVSEGSEAKPARPKWAWKPFNNQLARVEASIDHLGKVYGASNSAILDTLKERLQGFMAEFKAAAERLAAEKKHGAQLPMG